MIRSLTTTLTVNRSANDQLSTNIAFGNVILDTPFIEYLGSPTSHANINNPGEYLINVQI